MFALAATNNAKYNDVIAAAQRFLSAHQIDEGEGYDRSHRYYGGIGYGGDERPDLSNQYLALEGLRASALDPKDPVWERAIVFLARCQNRSESNDQPWAANDGGFTYMPGWSPHGGTGSYGGMTHAGLISLLFAGVDKQDPRIQSAWKWIAANYDLEENPGVSGRHGLFYYYEAFAKTMFAMGKPVIKDGSGADRNWRNDLVAKLVSMQAQDGSWVNPYSSQWWENLKELITARGVIALNLALRK
jgi:squalene-hopene/tetraprenyl-beta-curcumene cyclase